MDGDSFTPVSPSQAEGRGGVCLIPVQDDWDKKRKKKKKKKNKKKKKKKKRKRKNLLVKKDTTGFLARTRVHINSATQRRR